MNLHPSLTSPGPDELAAFAKLGARIQKDVLRSIERRTPEFAEQIHTTPESMMQEQIHDKAMIAAVCAACAEAHGVNFFEEMLQAFAEIRGETSNPNPNPR